MWWKKTCEIRHRHTVVLVQARNCEWKWIGCVTLSKNDIIQSYFSASYKKVICDVDNVTCLCFEKLFVRGIKLKFNPKPLFYLLDNNVSSALFVTQLLLLTLGILRSSQLMFDRDLGTAPSSYLANVGTVHAILFKTSIWYDTHRVVFYFDFLHKSGKQLLNWHGQVIRFTQHYEM